MHIFLKAINFLKSLTPVKSGDFARLLKSEGEIYRSLQVNFNISLRVQYRESRLQIFYEQSV